MNRFWMVLTIVLTAWACTGGLPCLAQSPDASPPGEAAVPNEPLTIGVKPAAPFVMQDEAGEWTGISIELWESIAETLGVDYEFRETDLDGLIDGVAGDEFDLGVAALTITKERESQIDFTHAFYSTGLGIAVSLDGGSSAWWPLLRRVFSGAFLTSVLALAGVLLIVGIVLWVFERRRNAEQFGGKPHQGLGNAFWWAAVTMTTVGYGDKAPVTLLGRFVALIWMFASIIIISGFTAAIASALTVGQLGSSIRGPEDLRGRRVATIANSTSEQWLQSRGIARVQFDTPEAGLAAVRNGEVDAMVYDAPILKYLALTEMQGHITVLPGTFTRQDYAFALPARSPLREQVNLALLEALSASEWNDVLKAYLGNE